MTNQNINQQLRYLKEAALCLQRAGFHTEPILGSVLPVTLEGQSLGCVTSKGSTLIHKDNIGNGEAEDAAHRMADIAARTLEYMTMLECAPQLQTNGLEGDYRILADFGDAVLAGHPTERGVQFVTWEWDFDREGVHHGHYFQQDYEAAKRDFTLRSGLVQKDALFEPEQLAEIYLALSFVREQDDSLSIGQDQKLEELMEQVSRLLPEDILRQRDAPEQSNMTMQ